MSDIQRGGISEDREPARLREEMLFPSPLGVPRGARRRTRGLWKGQETQGTRLMQGIHLFRSPGLLLLCTLCVLCALCGVAAGDCGIPNCEECEPGGEECVRCRERYLVDRRAGSVQRGQCLLATACGGLAKAEEGSEDSAAACVDLGCAVVEGCSACEEEDENRCARCSQKGYGPSEDGRECRENDCKELGLEHCLLCGEGKCLSCEDGWLVNEIKRLDTWGTCMPEEECNEDVKPDGVGGCRLRGCKLLDHCATCDAYDDNWCAACEWGYYVWQYRWIPPGMEDYDFYDLPYYLGWYQTCQEGLMPEEIAGIAVSGTVVLAVVVFLSVYLPLRKKRAKARAAKEAAKEADLKVSVL